MPVSTEIIKQERQPLAVAEPKKERVNRYGQENQGVRDLLGRWREKAEDGRSIDDLIELAEASLDVYVDCLRPEDFTDGLVIEFLERRTAAIGKLHETKARIESTLSYVATPESFRRFVNRQGEAVALGTEQAVAAWAAERGGLTEDEKHLAASIYGAIMNEIAAVGFEESRQKRG